AVEPKRSSLMVGQALFYSGAPLVCHPGSMLKAITQFELTMVSANSKYDKVKRGEAQFTPYEQRGYAIFQAKCNTCHTEPLFTDNSFRNNGLNLNPFLKDEGRFGITGNAGDKGKFKVPSLRNVELTFPYMHDGRYYTLETVMEHYNSRIEQSATLDPLLKNGIPLSRVDVVDIVAFLKTLTDQEFVKDARFAQP
ncbi:MAG: cytochrome-c peroxidase, partial [Chitinophagaceae bacterium]